jgi:hypothetical protein
MVAEPEESAMSGRANGWRFAICCLVVLACTLAGAGTASAQAPANNDFTGAVPLVLGQPDNRFSNIGATAETGEALTSLSGERPVCGYAGNLTSQTNFTLWWTVVGTGRRVRVSTEGSNFDTHLGIFHGSINDPSLLCFDAPGTEFLEFDTTAGQIYHVQVGDCVLTPTPFNPGCLSSPNSAISVIATSPAAGNDNRAGAADLPTGQLVAGDNFAATEEAGEPVDCATPRGTSPYGRTVWYRWTAPAAGTAVFTATGFDTVLAVLPAGNVPLRCDDDPAVSGPSRIQLAVAPGDYFVQVAGFGRHAGFADSAQGRFNVSAEFTPDPPPPPPDSDGDGIPDSRDACPTVKPTRDANNDGCQDKPTRILADLKYDGRFIRRGGAIRGIALTRVRLTRVPTGATVRVTCATCRRASGRGGTRAFRSFSFKAKKAGTQAMGRLNRLQLVRGKQIVVVVTAPEHLGRKVVVKLVGRRDRVKLTCLAVGSRTKRVACSTGA